MKKILLFIVVLLMSIGIYSQRPPTPLKFLEFSSQSFDVRFNWLATSGWRSVNSKSVSEEETTTQYFLFSNQFEDVDNVVGYVDCDIMLVQEYRNIDGRLLRSKTIIYTRDKPMFESWMAEFKRLNVKFRNLTPQDKITEQGIYKGIDYVISYEKIKELEEDQIQREWEYSIQYRYGFSYTKYY